VVPLVNDLRSPEVRDCVRKVFDALGPAGLAALADRVIERHIHLHEVEALGPMRICAAVVERARQNPGEAARCLMGLSFDKHQASMDVLGALARDSSCPWDRRLVLRIVSQVRDPERNGWVVSVLRGAALDDEPAVVETATQLLVERGESVTENANEASAGSAPEFADAPLSPSQKTLPRSFTAASIHALFKALSESMGDAGPLRGPRCESSDLPTEHSYLHHTITMEHWSAGQLELTVVREATWHDKEGGGESTAATISMPGGITLVIPSSLDRFEGRGPPDGAARAERLLLGALRSLGWGGR